MAGGMVSGDTYFGMAAGSRMHTPDPGTVSICPTGHWVNATGALNADTAKSVKNITMSFEFLNITASF
jgi:hypothetical protein